MQVLLVAVAGLTADQLSKAVVARRLATGTISFGRFLHIRLVGNATRNARLGRLMAIVWVLAVASVVLLVQLGLYFDSTLARVGLGLALGGAAGNLFDRLRRGRIIDFIEFGLWPAFNLADIAIVVGLPLAFIPRMAAAL